MAWAMAIPAVANMVGGMAGQANSAADADEKRRQARAVAEGMDVLHLPQEDYSYIDYAGDYNPYNIGQPEAAQYQTINEDPQTRSIEMAALQQLAGQANGAADAQNAAARFKALDDANQMANQREGAIRQRMERTGQGGTGLNALMQAQSAQMGANRARQGTMDAVSQAALQKLAAQQMMLQGAGQVRGQDFNTSRYNTDTINEFNKFNTQARNRINQLNTENQNAAQLRNLNTRQDLAGRNTGITNMGIDQRRNNRIAEHNSANDRAAATINAINGQATQANTNGQMWNQMGQQGSQLFTNIGAGLSAAQNANKQNTSDDNEGEWI
jgi:hypothetical protein